MPVEPAPHASPLIRPWFGMSRGDDGKTRVTFVWEPATRVPGDRVRRTVSKLVVPGAFGRRRRAVRGTGRADRSGDDRRAGGAACPRGLRCAAGLLRLRMSIQDAASTVLDQDVRELSMRRPEGRRRGRHAGDPARAERARVPRARRRDRRPVASREFSRTERLLIRLPRAWTGR